MRTIMMMMATELHGSHGLPPTTSYAVPPTMIWLMGMKMSLTKKPMKPMTTKPAAVRMQILLNSFLSGFVHRLTSRMLFLVNSFKGVTTLSMLLRQWQALLGLLTVAWTWVNTQK